MPTYEYADLLIVDTSSSLPSSARRGQYAHTKDTNKLYFYSGSAWTLLGGGATGVGDVTGPSSAVNENIALFSGTTGKAIKDGLTSIGDLKNASNINAGTLALARGGTGASLSDPNADRILFWDDSGGAANWLTVGSGLFISGTTVATSASGGDNDPDTPGASDDQDEFLGGVAEKSWSWGNQESATATLESGGLTLYKPADLTGLTAYLTTGPDGSLTDWTMVAKMQSWAHITANALSTIVLVATGTASTPTLLYTHGIYTSSTTGSSWLCVSYTSYTSGSTTVFNNTGWTDPRKPVATWLMMRYTSSTKDLQYLHSLDGRMFKYGGSSTLASHPTTTMGLQNAPNNATYGAKSHWSYVRWWNSLLGGTIDDTGSLFVQIGL